MEAMRNAPQTTGRAGVAKVTLATALSPALGLAKVNILSQYACVSFAWLHCTLCLCCWLGMWPTWDCCRGLQGGEPRQSVDQCVHCRPRFKGYYYDHGVYLCIGGRIAGEGLLNMLRCATPVCCSSGNSYPASATG